MVKKTFRDGKKKLFRSFKDEPNLNYVVYLQKPTEIQKKNSALWLLQKKTVQFSSRKSCQNIFESNYTVGYKEE